MDNKIYIFDEVDEKYIFLYNEEEDKYYVPVSGKVITYAQFFGYVCEINKIKKKNSQ
jgi:hypothetical protein